MVADPVDGRWDLDPGFPVARARQMPPGARAAASTAALVAGVGHAGTFLSLSCGSLWLAAQGAGAFPLVQKVFIAGLFAQVLPVLGFAVVARHLSKSGRPPAALAAGGLSLVSLLLMVMGTPQVLGGEVPQAFVLALSLVVVTAIGVGVLGARLAATMMEHYEPEPVVLPPDPVAS